MVDVDRRITGLTPAHAAGLRRLSVRAAAAAANNITSVSSSPSTTTTTSSGGLHSFGFLANSIVSHLRSSNISLRPGLSDADIARAEAEFGFHFPPDLKAVLSLALPSGPGFPDWRAEIGSANRLRLRTTLDLPIAAVSLQIASHDFWPKSWGPRPPAAARALRAARAALRRAPLLVPLFDRCYVSSLPCIAGNPVFLVDDSRISLFALDLADFFRRLAPSPNVDLVVIQRQRSTARSREKPPLPSSSRRSLDSASASGRPPRWIEFWSEAAAFDRRRRDSSFSDEAFLEIRPPRVPEWVGSYLDRLGSVLRNGGWGDSDVEEMVHVPLASSAMGWFEAVDSQAVYDALLLRADRFSGSLRRAGWSSDEVSDVLGFDFRPEKAVRPPLKFSPEVVRRIGQLAAAVSGR